MTPEEFGELLKMLVEMTYFRFQGKIYEQTYEMAMGSLLSPGLSNFFIAEFKMNCCSISTNSTLVLVLNSPLEKRMRFKAFPCLT